MGWIPEPEAEEVNGDVYDRQRCIPLWNQAAVEGATVVVLGCGPLGQATLVALARCGVGNVVIIDNGVVQARQLARSLLASTADVGRPQAEAAMERIKVHTITTSYQAAYLDAATQWGQVVARVRAANATAVFDMTEGGEFVGSAINALCKVRLATRDAHTPPPHCFSPPILFYQDLGVPLIVGSTQGYALRLGMYPGAPKSRCADCDAATRDANLNASAEPAAIMAWAATKG